METRTLTPDTILEALHEIRVPGFDKAYKGQRRTLAQWKEAYPFIPDSEYANPRYFGEFEVVNHPHVEVSVMADVYKATTHTILELHAQVLSTLAQCEKDAADTTVRYAYRIAHDELKKLLDHGVHQLPRSDAMENILLKAWRKRFGLDN